MTAQRFGTFFSNYESKDFEQGLTKGIKRGKVEGEIIGKVKAFAEMGLSEVDIAHKTGISFEEVTEILEEQYR